MTDMSPKSSGRSLLERAAEVYDFDSYPRGPANGASTALGTNAGGVSTPSATEQQVAPNPPFVPSEVDGQVRRTTSKLPPVAISRELLAEKGLLVPGAPIDTAVEEFRLVKRHLLGTRRDIADPAQARSLLVCSANPHDGKTHCAINLALSLAAERDLEVLLVDADLAAPAVFGRLGLTPGAGLLDALAEPALDIESLVVPTDVPHLSLLPAGTKSVSDTELLASQRTQEVIRDLLAADPKRLIVFDSPPALAASPASVLAQLVGQVMLVVRADKTSEADLRQAVQLLDGCEHIQLVLNAVTFAPGGRRYGLYYGQETKP